MQFKRVKMPIIVCYVITHFLGASSAFGESGSCAELFAANMDGVGVDSISGVPAFLSTPLGSRVVTHTPDKPVEINDGLFSQAVSRLTNLSVGLDISYFRHGPVPDAVLYLASGIDGGLTHALVPEAKLHITIDDTPTFDANDLRLESTLLSFERGHLATWPYVQGGVIEHYAGPSILLNIIAFIKGHKRLREITIIVPPNELVSKYYGAGEKAVHFVLTYDRGEGTPLQYHWHIHGSIAGSVDDARDTWWYRDLEKIKPGAIMTKANSGAISNKMAQEFRRWANEKNGFVLDDSGQGLVRAGSDHYLFVPVDGGFGYGTGAFFSRPLTIPERARESF